MKRLGIGLLVLTMIIGFVLTASAEDPGAFFDGKRMTIVVPYGPGGGFDTYARLVAPYVEKYIPGLTVIVQNRPGAGSLKGTNDVYNADPDGLTVGIVNVPGCILANLTGQEGINFKIGEFNWLARVSAEAHLLTTGANSKFKTAEDLLNCKDTVLVATDGVGSDDYYALNIEVEAFNLDARFITGYSGSSEANLAVIRGEAHITQSTVSSQLALVQSGDVLPLILVGNEKPVELADYDLPRAVELAETAEQEAAMKTVTALFELDRSFATTPGVPDDRVEFMREAFKKAINDPEFIEAATKAKRPVAYLYGADVQELISDVGSELDKVKALM